jgi:hypothetical protein
MLAAREKLRPLLDKTQSGNAGKSWRNKHEHFFSGDGPRGSVNLSSGWFELGHDVSALARCIYFSAAHSESGKVAGIPAGFCEL